jgi:hypothetical protein
MGRFSSPKKLFGNEISHPLQALEQLLLGVFLVVITNDVETFQLFAVLNQGAQNVDKIPALQ